MTELKLRHDHYTDMEIITKYGRMILDEDGYVIDIERPPKDLRDILKTVPGIVDGDLFKPRPRPKSQDEQDLDQKKREIRQAEKKKVFTKDDYKKLITEMMDDESVPKNHEDYVDMGALTNRLRELKQKPITGMIRRRLQDEIMHERNLASQEEMRKRGNAQAKDISKGPEGKPAREENSGDRA